MGIEAKKEKVVTVTENEEQNKQVPDANNNVIEETVTKINDNVDNDEEAQKSLDTLTYVTSKSNHLILVLKSDDNPSENKKVAITYLEEAVKSLAKDIEVVE